MSDRGIVGICYMVVATSIGGRRGKRQMRDSPGISAQLDVRGNADERGTEQTETISINLAVQRNSGHLELNLKAGVTPVLWFFCWDGWW